jgi:hypothetical protein
MRPLSALVLFALAAVAQNSATAPPAGHLWPTSWGGHTLVETKPAAIAEQGLWNEYDGRDSESALYKGNAGKFRATAYRFPDSTSALAWYEAIRPENAVPAHAALSVSTTPGAQYIAHLNYVLVFEGWRPPETELAQLYPQLPQMRSGGGLPKLPDFLPEKGRIRNSERFILGVTSLEKFEPRIPPTLAGFEDGVEAQVAKYRGASGDMTLTLLEYPTPQLARKRLPEFEKQPGWAVKRSGTLIAVIPGATAAAAAPVLDQVKWKVLFTWNEATKFVTVQDVGKMMMAIFELAGVLLVVCLGGGLLFAGLWYFLRVRRDKAGVSQEIVTSLHLTE